MSAVIQVISYAVLLTQISLLAGTLIFIKRKLSIEFGEDRIAKIEDQVRRFYRELALIVALTATSGSLYMSNFLGWEPCRLCWFQRIAIYPLVVLLGTALVLKKDDIADYVMPLAMIGIPISVYHYMVQRIDQFHSAGCSVLSVSCETTHTFYFGYISIPMMALTALVAVLVLMWRFNPTEN